jgi:hypothetical protein
MQSTLSSSLAVKKMEKSDIAVRSKRLLVQINGDHRIENQDNFKKYANLISNLFTFNLPPVLITRTQKLNIDFTLDDDALFVFPKNIGDSIYTIKETFDLKRYKEAGAVEKKMFLTENVRTCLKIMYKHLHLNEEDVEGAYTRILNNDFSLILPICGKAKQNKSRTLKAMVTAEYLLGYSTVGVDFFDKNNEIVKHVKLCNTAPIYFIIDQIVKSARWVDNDRFMLSNNSKEISFLINSDGEISVDYKPVVRDIAGLKEQIEYLTSERAFEV